MRQGKINRNKSKEPKKDMFWCMGCDRNLVGESHKCSVCGCRNGKKKRRLKKSDPGERNMEV